MPVMSTHLANKVLDAILRNVAVQYPNVYISLHTGYPGDAGSNEVENDLEATPSTYGRYETVPANWDAADEKRSVNNTIFEFEDMPACSVSHVGLWDAEEGGNFLWAGELLDTRTVFKGDIFRFRVGDLVAEIDPEEV